MALKDKLMTLEDFKAVRDVDVASNSAQFTEIKADLENLAGGGTEQREIQFVYGSYINDGNAAEIGGTVNLTNLTEWYSLKHAIVECQEGDEFLIDVVGATNARAWAFLTSNNVLLSRSNENETVTGKITAPQNAGKVIIQAIYRQSQTDTSTDNGTAYKVIAEASKGVVVRFDTAQDLTDSEKARARENIGVGMTDGLSDEVKEAILDCFRNVAWLDGTNGEESFNALLEALNESDASDFYNTWEWTYPGNLDMYKGTPAYFYGSNTDGVLFDNTAQAQNIKRTIFTNKGKLAAVEAVDVPGDVFPIPIPSGATSVSAKINPSTMQVLLQRWVLQGDVYKLDSMTSWNKGTANMSFNSANNTFICVNIRYNSQSSAFPNEPQGFEMVFR